MMFHWVMAVAAVTLGFLIQLGFPKDPNPDVMPTLFNNKIYHLNIPLYIVGTLILIVGYFLVWKLWLREDWLLLKGKGKGWSIAKVVLEVINYIILFFLFYLVMYVFVPGMYGDGYRWVDYSIFGVWVVLLAIQLLVFRKKSE